MKIDSELVRGKDRSSNSVESELAVVTRRIVTTGIEFTHEAGTKIRQEEGLRVARLTAGEDPEEVDPTSHNFRAGAAFVLSHLINDFSEMIPVEGMPERAREEWAEYIRHLGRFLTD